MSLLVCGVALPLAPSHASAAQVALGGRNLKQGMHGHDVRVLQGYLTQVGVKTTVDGQYGPTTTSHVRTWERKSSLRVDGRVTKKTAAVLRGQVANGGSTLQSLAPGSTGGAQMLATAPPAGSKATLDANGDAVAPVDAPPQVVAAIAAANAIDRTPYVWGGGHGSFNDSGYDCSGAVSAVLHGAGALSSPLDSGSLMSWGESGSGQWITVYTNPGHAFVVVAGLRFDTGYHDSSSSGPRWSSESRPTSGFTQVHPAGL